MNGMRYMLPKFSCPASQNTSQYKWDLAFMSPSDFKKKYGITLEEASLLPVGYYDERKEY